VATAAVPRGTAVNADASLGTIVIGGNLRGVNIVAGATTGPDARFGSADDAVIALSASASNDPKLFSKIASVVIKGAIVANPAGPGAAYGIVAQNVVSVKLGTPGTAVALQPGTGNDRTPTELGGATNFHVLELPLP
jgi:hypothetical protein